MDYAIPPILFYRFGLCKRLQSNPRTRVQAKQGDRFAWSIQARSEHDYKVCMQLLLLPFNCNTKMLKVSNTQGLLIGDHMLGFFFVIIFDLRFLVESQKGVREY